MKKILSLFFALLMAYGAPIHADSPLDAAKKGAEGYVLFTRDSLPSDRQKGYDLMLQAAWEGDAKSANNIGWLSEHGIFIEKNLPAAMRWYLRASDQGLPAAALNYVSFLQAHPEASGDSVHDPSNIAEAAMTAAVALATGRGLPYDYRKGEELMLLAALLGNEKAALTIAQQLEMYPESYSYLPLQEIVRNADSLLPPSSRIVSSESTPQTLAEIMLNPQFWYSRIRSSNLIP